MKSLSINNEECRSIDGFDRYHISESGRVYRTDLNTPRSARSKDKIYLSENKVHYKIGKNTLRHGRVSITDNTGKLHNKSLSTLVCMAFNNLKEEEIDKSKEIGYRDEDNKNLHYSNLYLRPKSLPNYKLNKKDVQYIRKYIRKKVPLNKIGKIFNVSEMQINRIKTGENWGNGKRKIKAPKAPFEIEDVKIRKYIAIFDRTKTAEGIKKPFKIKRNPDKPTDNLIVGILKGYKLTLKHTNITRANENVEKLNRYFFNNEVNKATKPSVNTQSTEPTS